MAYRILIVDDSSTIRRMLKKAISMAGLDVGIVMEAADGEEALAALKENWVDVVFSDIHMPNMSGDQLVEKMAADGLLASIPVVIVSSDRNQALRDRLEKWGVQAYITKPFRPESFKEVIHQVLEAKEGANLAD